MATPLNSPVAIPERVKSQWEQMALIEEDHHAVVRRDLKAYVSILKGLTHFLNYAASIPSSNTIVDIGAGEAVAVNELAAHELGNNLNFLATGIVAPTDYNMPVPYIKTGAETLGSIEDRSVNGAIAVHSIIFSAAPDMVVSSLNKVLVDGGVVKTKLVQDQNGYYIPLTQGAFQSEFESAGFDVAFDPDVKILLAMKPCGESSVDAAGLLQADLESYKAQLQQL